MPDPFEVDEANQAEETGPGPVVDLLAQLFADGATPSAEEINQKVIRAAPAREIAQRSKLKDELDDLQAESLHERRGFYLKLLEVGDSLDRLLRMLNPASEGIETINAVRTQFLQVLERVDIHPLEVSAGQAFDMKTCEVNGRQERPDLPPNTIIAVERRGYMWGDKVLRHARVNISVNSKGA